MEASNWEKRKKKKNGGQRKKPRVGYLGKKKYKWSADFKSPFSCTYSMHVLGMCTKMRVGAGVKGGGAST